MFSERRRAQLGLAACVTVLIGTLSVLFVGSRQGYGPTAGATVVAGSDLPDGANASVESFASASK